MALLGAPGRRALLISESTRIPGLISIVDVAPTALGREGALTTQPHDDPVGYLRDLDARIRDNNTARLPAMLAVLAVITALAFLRPRAAVLAFANVAAVNLALGVVGVSSPWLVIVVLPLAAALALLQASRLGDGALGVTLASVIVAYLLAMALEPPSVALSPLGPTQNSRFYGFSNLLETLFLVPALAAAALLRRSWAFFAVAALTVVTVAGSRFGADAGGAVVLAAGYAALALALLPRRIALGTLGALAAATALALVVGPSTHLGNADLPEALAERVSLSFARATDNLVVALVVVAAVAALAVLVLRLRRLGLPPQQRALPVALAVAVACSLVVNDSPLDVSLIGLVSYLTLERFVRDRETESHPYNSGVPREGVVSP